MTDDDREQYDHDPDHSIPSLDVLDVIGKLRGGGAELVIVATSAVGPDMRTQHRLLKKIENYQRYILSEDFRSEFGPLTAQNTVIRVEFTQGAHPVITYFLETCRPFLADNGVTLVWEGE